MRYKGRFDHAVIFRDVLHPGPPLANGSGQYFPSITSSGLSRSVDAACACQGRIAQLLQPYSGPMDELDQRRLLPTHVRDGTASGNRGIPTWRYVHRGPHDKMLGKAVSAPPQAASRGHTLRPTQSYVLRMFRSMIGDAVIICLPVVNPLPSK